MPPSSSSSTSYTRTSQFANSGASGLPNGPLSNSRRKPLCVTTHTQLSGRSRRCLAKHAVRLRNFNLSSSSTSSQHLHSLSSFCRSVMLMCINEGRFRMSGASLRSSQGRPV
eukprot:CAMPEP_0175284880 /NCGR_PEP_ID=MMETSP0093-20121207/52938_1 /TAXON_ID=311494 /ORGANISM="Alexandrium monilatum, Strain CCMP3105" /LENGTH=111 /DNA_ID=CAMNT_0016580253 /DNA_START=96 /DNA_END=428 /DNA_ORIENTATION=+